MADDQNKLGDHHTGDAIPGAPVTDPGPQFTPGITTETAAPFPLENKWTADHRGVIPTPNDPDRLIPPTPRADPEADAEQNARETQPMRAEDVNKSNAEMRDEDKGDKPF